MHTEYALHYIKLPGAHFSLYFSIYNARHNYCHKTLRREECTLYAVCTQMHTWNRIRKTKSTGRCGRSMQCTYSFSTKCSRITYIYAYVFCMWISATSTFIKLFIFKSYLELCISAHVYQPYSSTTAQSVRLNGKVAHVAICAWNSCKNKIFKKKK